MSEMVERVAKELMLEFHGGYHIDPEANEFVKGAYVHYRRVARKVIEAMREPTDEMKAEMSERCGVCGQPLLDVEGWKRAIDAALK